jgi:hypothetical protein
MMLVMTPYPGSRPAATSAAEGLHWPVVARGLGRLRRHPEPDGRLEGRHDGVAGHQVRVAEQVDGDGLRHPGLPAVLVPARIAAWARGRSSACRGRGTQGHWVLGWQ